MESGTPSDLINELAVDLRRYLEWAREVEPQILREGAQAPSPVHAAVPSKVAPAREQARASTVTAGSPAPRPVQEARVSSALAPRAPISAPFSPPPAPAPEASHPGSNKTLEAIRADLGECIRCKLSRGRRNIVFGVGNPKAELVFVGEGPGPDEDVQGEPFVGAAGQLLDRMIKAMGFSRSEVYICNVVKCLPPVRPPNNRFPEPDEIGACSPFMHAQLEAIGPKVIVALGKCATQTLLGSPVSVSRVRGTWHTYRGIRLMPTFHPAYLLRSPQEKRKAWEDLQKVMHEFPGRGPS